MKRLKMILCAMLSVCIVSVPVFGSVVSVSAEDVDSLRTQLIELKEKESEYKAILSQSENEIADQKEYNDALVEKISVLGEKINLTRESIAKLNESIAENQKKIDEGNASIEGQLDALCTRLRAIYMAGSASELEIILGAKDFSDMIDKVNLVKTLTKYDDELIENISDKLDEIENKQTQMQEDKEQLLTDETTLDADLKDFNKTLEENEETLKKLRDSSAEAQDFLADADNEQTLMESQIRKYFEKKAQTADIVTDGKYVWPCPGYYTLSSLFRENRTSYFHGGIDIAGGGIMGSPVLAAEAGTVVGVFTGCPHNWGKEKCCACGSYGNYVWLDHGNGKETIYGHLTSAGVQPGDTVKKGQVIGLVGSTGNSTGPHLHFECRMNGDKYDPMTEF